MSIDTKQRPRSPRYPIGISISQSPDLEVLGYGREHLHELMITVARTALRIGGDETALVYGGDLRPGRHTRSLFALALGEGAGRRRLYNYLAWPYYLTLSKQQEAEMINTCYFVRVVPQQAGFPEVDARQPKDKLAQGCDGNLVAAACLTRMREQMSEGGRRLIDGSSAERMAARIIIGGEVSRYSSFMPGIYEEFLIARETGVPVYLLGGLGGAAGELVNGIVSAPHSGGTPAARDDPLQIEFHREQGGANVEHLIGAYERYDESMRPAQRFLDLQQALRELREDPNRFHNGLDADENRLLMQIEDVDVVRRLLRKGLEAVCPRPAQGSGG